jgi:dolichyl-phosphate-mannose-protein mannosyltransferase
MTTGSLTRGRKAFWPGFLTEDRVATGYGTPSRLAIVAAVSFTLLALGITNHKDMIGDEGYYVYASRAFNAGATTTNPEHPPLDKYLIAASIRAFGDNAVGWRFPSLLAGTLMAVALFGFTLRLTGDPRTAWLAWLLTIAGGSWYNMSRVAMLSPFEMAFGMAAIWLAQAALDTDRAAWFAGAGALFGLSVASRWFGVMGLIVCLAVAVWNRHLLKAVLMGAVAVTTYFATWVPLLIHEHRGLDYLVKANLYILEFHRKINYDPNAEPMTHWLQPLRFGRGMSFIANPVVGVLGLVALVAVMWSSRKRELSMLPVLMYVANLLPWAIGVRHGVGLYYYYFEAFSFLPIVLAIAIAHLKVGELRVDVAVTLLAFGYFAYWFAEWGHFPFGYALYY